MRCIEVFGRQRDFPQPDDFWPEVHRRFQYLVGRPKLTEGQYTNSQMQDVTTFLTGCSDEQFLDFIECIFQTHEYRRFWQGRDYLVDEINQLLLLGNIPYSITPSIWVVGAKNPTSDQVVEGESLLSHPKVICRDDQLMHEMAVQPALVVLRDEQFTSANQEFLEALEDYRKGDYDDCLTKCGSAFESTL
jgi:hypothetical protein